MAGEQDFAQWNNEDEGDNACRLEDSNESYVTHDAPPAAEDSDSWRRCRWRQNSRSDPAAVDDWQVRQIVRLGDGARSK
jgi:hypothetical protein